MRQLKMLIFGLPGGGKTRFLTSAAKVPELGPIVYLDMQGGIRSSVAEFIEHDSVLDLVRNLSTTKINAIRIQSYTQLNEICQQLVTSLHSKIKTVIFDNITEADYLAGQFMAKNDTNTDLLTPNAVEFGEINKLKSVIKKALKLMETKGYNILIAAHVKEKDDPGFTVKADTMSLTGELRQNVAGFVDYVGFVGLKNGKWTLTFRPTATLVVKYRGEDNPVGATDLVGADITMANFLRLAGEIPT